ncbi:MAG: hypothetical protein MSH10_05735 [Pygmaiobacter massiliensis]|nr:hypothetical protein [Pygmaiobacter massiliensis]
MRKQEQIKENKSKYQLYGSNYLMFVRPVLLFFAQSPAYNSPKFGLVMAFYFFATVYAKPFYKAATAFDHHFFTFLHLVFWFLWKPQKSY